MKILFLHDNIPAQFRYIAEAMGKSPEHEAVFGTQRPPGEGEDIPGVRRINYSLARTTHPKTHHYLHPLERAVLTGQGVYRMCLELKEGGFVPDVIFGHTGWGSPTFVKDVFPDSKLLCFFEWFYQSKDSDVDFDSSFDFSIDDEAKLRLKNAPILLDLASCDRGICPTHFQHSQFPPEWQKKIDVRFDGTDTDLFRPKENARIKLDHLDLDLSEVEEVVTTCSWGMEPQRGVQQVMRAIAELHQRRPKLHAVFVAAERVVYGRQREDGRSWKEVMMEELDGKIDPARIHFTGQVNRTDLSQILQASSAHIYLTRPFVLSWSMIDAMSSGCHVIGSATPPIMEIITDGENGELVDFFAVDEIADKVECAIDDPERSATIRKNARTHILENYSLHKLLPEHLEWIESAGNSSSA